MAQGGNSIFNTLPGSTLIIILLKMTKEARGTTVCILVQVEVHVKDETWDEFTEIPPKSNDDEVFTALEKDGLKLGKWVTVPDPYQEDWPFYKRHPGARCPPEIIPADLRYKIPMY